MSSHLLPELVPARIDVPERTSSSPMSRAVLTTLIAGLVATLAAAGWGFTQWSSARSWQDRAEKIEAQFDPLEARTATAEQQTQRAQRAAARTRKELVTTENRLSAAANQLAATRDLRAQFCEATPFMLDPEYRAQLCR
jgi:hypothetical protein